MISSILIASYLWKDTWKRWLEQPGSVLARSVVTIIMVSLSVCLLVGFKSQIDKLREEVKSFGLDNMLIVETITSRDIQKGVPNDRFRSLEKWGELFSARKLLASARGSNGKSAAVVAYSDSDIRGLLPYLKYGHEVFVLSNNIPQGAVVDYTVVNEDFTSVALKPEENISQIIQTDTLFIPLGYAEELAARGYSNVYYLQREPDAPSVEMLTDAINLNVAADGSGKVDIKSAAPLKKKLEALEEKQEVMRLWLSGILGGALALIYGVLSVLEFRQSMYVSALLKSFGVSKLMLGLRTIVENLLIVNVVLFSVVYIIAKNHDKIFKAFKVDGVPDIAALYWGSETLWVALAANIGVLLSSIPVFWALRKQVGNILE